MRPAPFLTVPGSGLTNSQFTIYYPTGDQITQGSYIAPLLHEMGHVFQLKQAGSYQKLKDPGNSKERIELGADFIAGLARTDSGLHLTRLKSTFHWWAVTTFKIPIPMELPRTVRQPFGMATFMTTRATIPTLRRFSGQFVPAD